MTDKSTGRSQGKLKKGKKKRTNLPTSAPVRLSVSEAPREKFTFCPKACGWPGFTGEFGKTWGPELGCSWFPTHTPWPGPAGYLPLSSKGLPSEHQEGGLGPGSCILPSQAPAAEQLTGSGQAQSCHQQPRELKRPPPPAKPLQ